MGLIQTNKPARVFCRNKLAAFFLAQAVPVLVAVPGVTQAEESVLTLEEVVVTARKREESLQDIPVAATVFSADALEVRGATDMADITASVPNMSYQDRAGGHQTSIGIRGISSNVRNIGLEDSVGIYVDGVYIGRPMFYNIDLAEVQQIEVLRGPQGTLFGKNTIAGALNITTKAVPEELEGKVTATVGNYGLRHIKGYVGGKFSDSVGGSLSMVKKKTDGFMDNLFNGDELQVLDQQGIGGKLQISPSDSLNIVLAADYSEKDNDVNASQLLVPGGGFAGVSFGDEPGGFFGGQYDAFDVNENGPQKYEEEVKGFSATIDYEMDNEYSLTVITAWRQMDLLAAFDDDNTSFELLTSTFVDEAEQKSLEVRLTSPGGQTFDWVLGAFYFDQTVDSNRLTVGFGSLNVMGKGSVDSESVALYFNGDYHINDELDLSIGLRYTEDSKEALWDQSGNGLVAFGFPAITHTGDETWEEVSPTIALTYAVSEDASIYAKASRGFKGGGFMTDLVGDTGFGLEPETVTNYELGLKSTLADGRMRLNAAIFQMDYDDLQTLNLNGLQFVGANAGKATLKGVEFDFQFLATEQLMLTGGVGYTDSKYDEFLLVESGTTFDLGGNVLRNAPEITANMMVEYRVPVSDAGELVLVGEWSYKDETYYDVKNADAALAPSYSLYNARVGFVSADEVWSVTLWGKNLGDKEYFSFLRDGPFGQQTGLFGKPRTFGVDFTLNF